MVNKSIILETLIENPASRVISELGALENLGKKGT